MPTYEYKCARCAHQFETFQSITAQPLKKCPECGKAALERLIGTGAAVLFKGSGFYQTDYRSSSYKKAAEADAKPAGDSASSPSSTPPASTSTPSTPAAKTPKKKSKSPD